MRRLHRLVVTVAAIGLLLTSVTPVGAARAEDYARVIRSRHAGATFVQVDGCRQVEVFVSAMDAKFGSRPGPVNKQGLVGVFYRELDICSGEGPRFPVVFSADAQSLDRLVSSPRFGTASIDVHLTGTDGDGNPVVIELQIDWTAATAFERSKDLEQRLVPRRPEARCACAHVVAWPSRGCDRERIRHRRTAPTSSWRQRPKRPWSRSATSARCSSIPRADSTSTAEDRLRPRRASPAPGAESGSAGRWRRAAGVG